MFPRLSAPRLAHAALVSALMTAFACGGRTGGPGPLRVSAAVSLTEALRAIADRWQQAGGPALELNFAASNVLARQILEGAPVDLFISADEAQVDRLVAQNMVDAADHAAIVSNRLVIVSPVGRPIQGALPGALADAAVHRIALGDPQGVPAGVYARGWLQREGLWTHIEPKVVPAASVRAALAAVEAGNADAGIVYRTDVTPQSKVTIAFEVPLDRAPSIVYPAAVVKRSIHRDAARRLLTYLQGQEAQEIFARAGFLPIPRAPQ
jgi:molybdate transport system substrate-binding protein